MVSQIFQGRVLIGYLELHGVETNPYDSDVLGKTKIQILVCLQLNKN
jgi:hypothetical protein